MDRYRKNATNTANHIFKVLCMFAECGGVRIEIYGLLECCVVCPLNVHNFSVIHFSDVGIDKAGPTYCNQNCRVSFPDITLKMIAESDRPHF